MAGGGLAHGPQGQPALAGEVGKMDALEGGQRLPEPCGRFPPTVSVSAGCDEQPGQASKEAALEVTECLVGAGEERRGVPALPTC